MRSAFEGEEMARTATCPSRRRARGRRSSLGDEIMWSGSVSRILYSSRSEDHSSVTHVTAVSKQPIRKLSTETGGSTASLFGLAPQGVCHAIDARARCGALLPHHFTLTSSCDAAVSFCCTFRRVPTPGRYPACCPSEFGLSSPPYGAAILRSTPHAKCNSQIVRCDSECRRGNVYEKYVEVNRAI